MSGRRRKGDGPVKETSISATVRKAMRPEANWEDKNSEDEDEDSEDENSAASSADPSVELQTFRQEWLHELKTRAAEPGAEKADKQGEAKKLFMRGVEAERAGKSSEAVYWYRRATHLCPDIESTINVPSKPHRRRLKSRASVDSLEDSLSTDMSSSVRYTQATSDVLCSESENESESSTEETEDLGNLLERFRAMKVSDEPKHCEKAWSQSAIHISELPTEIIIRIICWVIGKHVDIRSLDNVALVCRGFYVLSRDEQIWAKICRRIWGRAADCSGKYSLWRDMFLTRPHVHFNGCYISKMSYVRHGEPSIDDPFSLVVSVVEYFRYVRFYPNGRALMVTSPEEPSIMVYKLLVSNKIHGLLEGQYRLKDDKMMLILRRRPIEYNKKVYAKRRGENPLPADTKKDVYKMEFGIKNCGKRLNFALVWIHYSLTSKYADGTSKDTVFDLTYQNYPPMYFSPVGSYATTENGAL